MSVTMEITEPSSSPRMTIPRAGETSACGDFLIGRGCMSPPFANYQAVILRNRCCSTVKAPNESCSPYYDDVNHHPASRSGRSSSVIAYGPCPTTELTYEQNKNMLP